MLDRIMPLMPFSRDSGSPNSDPRSVRIVLNKIYAKLAFQLVKNKFYGTFGASVHNECKKQFFTG